MSEAKRKQSSAAPLPEPTPDSGPDPRPFDASPQPKKRKMPASARRGRGRVASVLYLAALCGAILMPLAAALSVPDISPLALVALMAAGLVSVAAAVWFKYHRRPSAARRRSRLERAIDASPTGIYVADGAAAPIYANSASQRLLGWAPEDSLKPLVDLLEGQTAAQTAVAGLTQNLAAEGKARGMLPIQKNGSAKTAAVAAVARAIPEQDLTIWQFDDGEPLSAANQALAAAQTKISEFIDASPIGLCMTDGAGVIEYANRRMAEWLGESAADLAAGRVNLGERLKWNSADAEAAARALTGSAVRQGAATLTGDDGERRLVQVRERISRGSDGKPERVVLSVTDPHDGDGAANSEITEQAFSQFLDFAPVGVVLVEAGGQVLHANQAFRAMTDVADGGVGRTWQSLLHGEDRSEVQELLSKAANGAEIRTPVEVRIKNSLRETSAQLFATRFGGGGGHPHFILHLIDTTEQKELELRFFQSQKMQAVGQLAGGVAHDFNNLLTAMIGFCDLLLLHHPPGDPSFSDIMHIKQNANRAANLVRQLLAFSRQQTLRPKVLVVTDILAELSNLLRRLIGENIELKIVHGRDMVPVKVDQGQFEQVIINLAVNARDAMEGGGTLTIRTANITTEESTLLGHELMEAGEYALIEVADTGRGIPKANIGKIYEPFFTTKEVGAGTGLGLSTVYGIIKQTGGNIWVESELGKGTTFRIYLPRHVDTSDAVAATENSDNVGSQDLTGKETILLVEDEEAVRMFAARALKNKGYTVLQADSGDAALEVIRSHDDGIDLMVSDVVMPHMDGPTLVQHARAERPDMKIIFISGYAEDAFRKNMDGEAKEIEFLPKPFSLTQLAGKVKDVLGA